MQYGLLVAIAALYCGALAACSGSSKPLVDEQIVNVYSWADYIAPDTIANFERETGIKVRYGTFDSDDVLATKLLTGHTGYDVVVPTDYFLGRFIQAGAFQPLDNTALPNKVNLDSEIMSKLATHDPGNQYTVPYLWFTVGLGYNIDQVQQRLGSDGADSWALLLDPKNAMRLQDCGIHVIDAPEDVFSAVLLYLGRNPASRSADDLNAAGTALMSIRPFVRSIDSVSVIGNLANGSTCMVLGWSGDVMQAKSRALESSKPVKLRYMVPSREGGLIGISALAIPADAPHLQNAEKWINYLMRPDVMAAVTNSVKYPNGNRAALELVRDDIKADSAAYPDAQTFSQLHPLTASNPEQLRLVTRLWTRFRTGQ